MNIRIEAVRTDADQGRMVAEFKVALDDVPEDAETGTVLDLLQNLVNLAVGVPLTTPARPKE